MCHIDCLGYTHLKGEVINKFFINIPKGWQHLGLLLTDNTSQTVIMRLGMSQSSLQ